ncbi:hypothetical protein JW992_10385, partial [candidate division KSB1 bacterium]|nr:hypothetical protein [candidate division KSB1 bacterium]
MKLVRPFLLLLMFSAFALAQTPYYVNGASGDNNWSGLAPVWDGVDGPKATIQAGIDAASPGDIVNIAAGTYTESMAVNKWIVLQGAGNGSDPTSNTVIHAGAAFNNITLSAGGSSVDQRLIIKNLYLYNAGGSHNGFGISGAGPYNHITLENVSAQNYQHGAQLTGPVTLSDLVVQDCTFSNNSQQGFAIRTNAAIDGLQFNNCTMINNREACLYLYPSPATLSNLEVNGGLYEQAQLFGNIALLGPIATASFTGVRSGNSTSNAVLFYTYGPITDVTFTDCEFYDASSGVNFYNTGSGSITNASVLGGTIDNCSGGIPIRNATNNVLIDGVQITNSSTYGIRIAGGNTLIQNSRIENNATGIRVTDTPVLPIAANNNIIMNNTLAVDNQTSVLLDAEENFWGACNGPEDAIGVTEVAFGDADPGPAALLNQEPAGLLDNSVNENVDYFPWLCTPPQPPGGPVEPLFFATPTAGYPGMVVTFQNH